MSRLRILKTYFLEILLVFTIAILATIVTLSWFLNTHFERSTAMMVNTLNQEFLSETHRINDYLQKMIKISGMELFLEPSVQALMYREDLSNFEIVTGIRRLDAVMSTNLHIHSIYAYNATKGYIFTTSNLDSDHVDRFKDQGVLELLGGSADQRRLAPIPRYFPNSSEQIPIYSFIFYTIGHTEPRIKGALVMNISLDWLKEVFQDTEDSNSQILFVDAAGTVAYHSDTSQFLENISNRDIFRQMVANGRSSGYFIHGEGSEKSYVFFSKSEDTPLYLMRIFPYEVIMEGIVDMRDTTLLLILLCVAIALLFGFIASRRLYKPINQLVARVERQNRRAIHEEGELHFLSSSIDNMLDQVEATESYRTLLQVDILKEILMGKIEDPHTIAQQFHEYGIPFKPDIPLQLFALKPCPDQVMQTLSEYPGTFAIPFEGDRTLVVTQGMGGNRLDQFLGRVFSCGTTVVVCSRRIEHPHQLGLHAPRLLEELRFSFLYREGCLMEEQDLKRSLVGGTYPSDLEKTMLRLLHQGHSEDAFECYDDFIEAVSRHSFTHFRFSMKRLYISMQLLVKELQENGCFSDYQEMGIAKFETLIEHLESRMILDDLFRTWFKSFDEELQRCRAEKNRTIVERIKQVIDLEYANPNLCLQFLADTVGLSVSYITKLFKEIEGISLSDHWFEKRMGEAVKLLMETDVLVKEIALSVGFVNENYFFTVFKKQFGITPNEYRRMARLKNSTID